MGQDKGLGTGTYLETFTLEPEICYTAGPVDACIWLRSKAACVFHPERTLSRSGRVYQQLAGLTPADPWGNSRQNCLHGMRIVGNTQLVWNGQ